MIDIGEPEFLCFNGAMITLASWNINSIKARLDVLNPWLAKNQPDVVLLQEIKCTDENFPSEAMTAAGYHSVFKGQPSYNGVAVLSKSPVTLIADKLPRDDSDTQARFLDVLLGDLRIIDVYAPNGNPLGSEKFTYKLEWLKRLRVYAQDLLDRRIPFIIGGDFNIIPTDKDAKFPNNWQQDALFQPESQAAWRSFVYGGMTDAFRMLHPREEDYTFWDYQAGAFQRNNGIRIDHFLLSPYVTDRLEKVRIDKEPRGWEKPSDHTPILIDVNI